MIPAWRQIQRQNFTKISELALFLELADQDLLEIDASPNFVLNLPLRLAQKMQKKTINDPLFKQFVPLKKERLHTAGFEEDPVQDVYFRKNSKLLHKYEGRALIISTSACAMHCRYCFRKNFPYETENPSFAKELEVLRNDSSIEEVLLSGGDPLSLSNATLKSLLDDLAAISHIKRIRFHTRFPIGIPERIDMDFLAILNAFPKQIWFVIHANHFQEFDDDIWQALKSVQKLGIPVLNQSVLLKDINDDVEVLKRLSCELVNHGIVPYYLHQLDRVQGSAHFEVPEEQGHVLVEALQKQLPGYAVPKYVREIAGKPSKTLLHTLNRPHA